MGPLSYDQAVALRDRGALKPETFNSFFGQQQTEPVAPMAPMEQAPAAAPAPTAEPAAAPIPSAPAIDPDEARRESQRQFFQQHKAGVADLERQKAETEAQAAQARAVEGQAELERRRDLAAKMGYSPEETEKQLDGYKSHLASLETEAGKKTAGLVKTGGFESDAGGDPNVVLASDVTRRGFGDSSGYIQGSAPQNPYDALALGAGLDMQAQGIKQAAAVGRAKAAEESAYFDRMQKDDATRIETLKTVEAERQKKLDAAFASMETAAANLATQKIDPNRFWANKSTGDKVLAGIGLFLGAFGRGDNKAVGVITDAINRDIEAQKADVQTQKDAYNAQKGIYADMFATYKDRRLAEEATRVAYLDNAELKIKEIASRYSGGEAGAKATMLLGEIQTKKDAAKAEFAKQFMASIPVSAETNPEMLKPEQRDRFVPGYGLALTKEDASKLKTHLGDASAGKSNLRRLMQIGSTPGKATDLQMRSEAQTLVKMLQGQLRTQIIGPGAVTETEWKLLDDIFADPTKLWSLDNNNRTRLQTVMNAIDRQSAELISTYGLKDPRAKLDFQTAGK